MGEFFEELGAFEEIERAVEVLLGDEVFVEGDGGVGGGGEVGELDGVDALFEVVHIRIREGERDGIREWNEENRSIFGIWEENIIEIRVIRMIDIDNKYVVIRIF